jgi:PLP dependent protein
MFLNHLTVEKAGVGPNETPTLAQYILRECPHLEFSGLMTIGSAVSSFSAQEQQKNPDFEVFPSSVIY